MYNWQSGGGVMAMPAWGLSGQYYETCSCDFVCPCLPGQLTVSPTRGSCTFAMAFQIDRGSYGNVSLDGLGFIILDGHRKRWGRGIGRSVSSPTSGPAVSSVKLSRRSRAVPQ